jgi:hypothetical protein
MRLICDVPIKFGNAPDDARPFKINDLSAHDVVLALRWILRSSKRSRAGRRAAWTMRSNQRPCLAQKLHHLRPFRRGPKWARP